MTVAFVDVVDFDALGLDVVDFDVLGLGGADFDALGLGDVDFVDLGLNVSVAIDFWDFEGFVTVVDAGVDCVSVDVDVDFDGLGLDGVDFEGLGENDDVDFGVAVAAGFSKLFIRVISSRFPRDASSAHK